MRKQMRTRGSTKEIINTSQYYQYGNYVTYFLKCVTYSLKKQSPLPLKYLYQITKFKQKTKNEKVNNFSNLFCVGNGFTYCLQFKSIA